MVAYEPKGGAPGTHVLRRRRVKAAQLRKEVRYHELVENITLNGWNAKLLTLEVGARGLIGNGTFRAFEKLGFVTQTANPL